MNILLLTRNYLYEQRWVILGAFGYALFLTVLYGTTNNTRSELSNFLYQQGIWAATFSILVASSTLSTDLRTRRVLGILSKAVHRHEYLAGIALAAWSVVIGYFVIVVIACATVPHLRLVWNEAVVVGLCAACGSLIAIFAVTAMSLLLPAFFASIAAAFVVFAPGILATMLHSDPTWLSPATACALSATHQRPPTFELLLACLLHTALWFALGTWVFSRRDIAAASE